MSVLWRSAFQALNTEFTQQELNLRFQPLTRKQSLWEKSKPVNAALLSAQSVRGAFAIVKASLLESLGIIKIAEATGIDGITAKGEFEAKVYTVDGVLLGIISSNKDNLVKDITKLGVQGVCVVKLNNETVKIVIR